MDRVLIRCVLFVGLLWSTIGMCAAEVSYEALLREADRIRTADTQRFQRLLADLDRAVERATPAQRMHLRLLHAHKLIITGDLPAAIRELKDLRQAATADVDLQYRAGGLLASAYAVTREFREGLLVIESTMVLADKVQDRNTRNIGWTSAGVLYNQFGQYRLVLDYADKVLSGPADGRSRCIAENLRLEALRQLGTASDDREWLAAVSHCEAMKEPILTGFIRTYLARKWHGEGRTDDATILLEKHLGEVEATGYPRLIAEVQSLLAEYRLSTGDLATAEQYAKGAIEQSKNFAGGPALALSHKVLYQIAERRQDTVGALANYRKYAEADKNYLDEVKTRELAYQTVRHESLQKTQQIQLLNGQNQLLLLQQRVDQQANQNTRLMMLLLALLVALIGYWAYKVKRVQQSLRRFAETDALTGISNRHHFTLHAEQALAQSAADGEACALIMFDLDHFKLINDSYGHDIGDWVLKQVARTCEGLCRRIDQLGRLGGEEFAILLRGIDLNSATRLAEDCRVRLTQIDSRESGHAFVVTASFGVSATPMSGYNLAKLLSHADQMLYSGKRSGRNRVHAYTGELFLHPPQLQVVPKGDEGHAKRAGSPASHDPIERLHS